MQGVVHGISAKRVASHALSQLLKLPAPTTDFTVNRGLRVPMRDGVDLIAHHYAPQTSAPAGTLLVRCPYGRAFPFSTLFGAVYAARGYHVVIQSVRGTFGSGGEFTPMIHEVADGADTVAWLRNQAWFTGSFATIGLSYLGFTQWALLMEPPPEMAAAIISVGPHDFSKSAWGTGSFTINDFLGWSDMMSHQEDANRLLAAVQQGRSRRRVARTTREVPMGAAGRTLLGAGAPWWESWAEHPDREDPFWTPLRLTEALDRVDVPVLLFSGWQDLFLDQTLTQFQHLHGRKVTTALTVGPWTHTELMTKGAPIVIRESLSWLDSHLAGTPAAPPEHGAGLRQQRRLARPSHVAAGDDRARAVSATCAPTFDRTTGRLVAPVDVHLRSGRSHAHHRRSPPVTRGRLSRRHQARRAARRRRLHRRPTDRGPLRDRHPGDRTVPHVRQPRQRRIRSAQRGRRSRADRRTSPKDSSG